MALPLGKVRTRQEHHLPPSFCADAPRAARHAASAAFDAPRAAATEPAAALLVRPDGRRTAAGGGASAACMDVGFT